MREPYDTETLTDFDPAEARKILDKINAAKTEYWHLTHRSAQDDIDLLDALDSLETMGDLTEGTTTDDAMAALYRAGETALLLGREGSINDACWEVFTEEVDDAVRRVGLYVEDPPYVWEPYQPNPNPDPE